MDDTWKIAEIASSLGFRDGSQRDSLVPPLKLVVQKAHTITTVYKTIRGSDLNLNIAVSILISLEVMDFGRGKRAILNLALLPYIAHFDTTSFFLPITYHDL